MVLEEMRSDLEAEVEKLKQLEVLPSDIEKLAMVHIHVPCSCVCMCAYVCVCVHVCDPFLVQVSCDTWLACSRR